MTASIEAMARKAGFCGPSGFFVPHLQELTRFAALVRAQALADAARVCEGLSGRSYEFDMGRLHSAAAIRALPPSAG